MVVNINGENVVVEKCRNSPNDYVGRHNDKVLHFTAEELSNMEIVDMTEYERIEITVDKNKGKYIH